MDIRQLRYFIAIAEEKNITAAANRLHISQPPLSMQLKQLEQELGVNLVERNGKRMELTDKGRLLYNHALHLVNSLEEVKNELAETEEGRKGTLALGINTLSFPGITELLHQFHGQYPQVTFKIVQNDSAFLSEQIRNRTIELAFIRLPLEQRDLTYQHLYSEPFVFVTKEQTPSQISLKELAEYPIILPSTEGLGLYHTIAEAFSREHLSPATIGECSDTKVLIELVTAGIGSTILPRSVLQSYALDDLNSVPLLDTDMNSSLGIIWLQNHFLSSPARHFLELVKTSSTLRS
ncbi:LysR family transcriptional regulator [Mesobacillus zeae]|uniref:LysR family transcriptional regulator n=1 Tax=Mesobacillus zeae TaxID=1917180 RepID=A0A398BAC4_9BACI|nr:LysR family transcriptional regulator [Mesobacillus zeae]RID85798.1 LysR family transcriptional regulator [Mesobacillus zeae]